MLKVNHDKNPEYLNKRIKFWCNKIGVFPSRVRIQKMKNKWASCSSNGVVIFNTDLLKEQNEFCEYVIIHELLHLQVPNHGKLFKALLHSYTYHYWEMSKNRTVCNISDKRISV